jgi:hypothetical protein
MPLEPRLLLIFLRRSRVPRYVGCDADVGVVRDKRARPLEFKTGSTGFE